MNRCLKCNGLLATADINGICSKCRGETPNHSLDVQDYMFEFYEPYWKMLEKQVKKMKRRKINERKAKRSGIKWNQNN